MCKENDVPEMTPTTLQILSEWSISDSSVDRALWQKGIDRYGAGSLKDPAGMELAAELLCVALAHYLNGEPSAAESGDEWPRSVVDHTVWDVLVATLQAEHGTSLTPDANKCLRLALAAVRKAGLQSPELGGNGWLSQFFEDARYLHAMAIALSGDDVSADEVAIVVFPWFTGGSAPTPSFVALTKRSPSPIAATTSASSGDAASESHSTIMKGRVGGVAKRIDPLALQHGIEAMQDALTGSGLAKTDKKTGKLKIKKTGVMRAAVRPGKTARKALGGVGLTEHLKSYNQEKATPEASEEE
jgi:hypothetical protein